MERNISVIKNVNGNQIVIVNDIRFKGKRNINWDEVEQYLKQYVGEFIQYTLIILFQEDRHIKEYKKSGRQNDE